MQTVPDDVLSQFPRSVVIIVTFDFLSVWHLIQIITACSVLKWPYPAQWLRPITPFEMSTICLCDKISDMLYGLCKNICDSTHVPTSPISRDFKQPSGCVLFTRICCVAVNFNYNKDVQFSFDNEDLINAWVLSKSGNKCLRVYRFHKIISQVLWCIITNG